MPLPLPRAMIFDATAQDDIDVTSTEILRGLIKELRASGIGLYLTDVHGPVLERGRITGLLDAIGEDHVFPSVDFAVHHLDRMA